jgi:uncharacterized membrane protein
MQALVLYLTALVVFLVGDAIWLGVIAKQFYREQLGALMAEQVRWGAAALFYALYLVGILVFCVLPHLEKTNGWIVLGYGAFFGLICYATYDLTNLATLRGFPTVVAIVDLCWGAVITGVTAWATWWVGHRWMS